MLVRGRGSQVLACLIPFLATGRTEPPVLSGLPCVRMCDRRLRTPARLGAPPMAICETRYQSAGRDLHLCSGGTGGDRWHGSASSVSRRARGLSRAAFARIFQLALGQPPMQYLADWRMTLARDHLRAGELTLTQISERTGYASPYAFAAAFRRHHGIPPGQWRRQERANQLAEQVPQDQSQIPKQAAPPVM